MKRFSEADLLAFERIGRLHGYTAYSIIEQLTAYLRATVGVEPIPPMSPGEPPNRLDRLHWRWGIRAVRAAAEYRGWEERWAAYGETCRRAENRGIFPADSAAETGGGR